MKYIVTIVEINEHPDFAIKNEERTVYAQTFDEMALVKTVSAINLSVCEEIGD